MFLALAPPAAASLQRALVTRPWQGQRDISRKPSRPVVVLRRKARATSCDAMDAAGDPITMAASLLARLEGTTAPPAPLQSSKNTSSSSPPEVTVEDTNDLGHVFQATHDLALSTQIVHFKASLQDPYSATSTPIYQTATFKQPSAVECGEFDYTRSGNPTRAALEQLLAKIEGADRAFAFSSGMGALAAAVKLLNSGDEILAGDDLYGGTDRLLSRIVPRAGITVRRVDTSDLNSVAAGFSSSTKLVMLESPTNPRQRISDIRAICKIAHDRGALVLIDNSILSPVISKPIELGVDIVMHSATKFMSGHADVMAGVLAVKGEELAKEIYFVQNAEGSGLAPFDSWLVLRGLKTMPLRMERQQASAMRISEFLYSHPKVQHVYYPGLPSHPGFALHQLQATGGGSVLSFSTGSLAVSRHVVESMQLASIAVSFGSVSTTISLPCFMSHASIPEAVRVERGLVEDLVRISVGIEDVGDLLRDLGQALDSAPAAV